LPFSKSLDESNSIDIKPLFPFSLSKGAITFILSSAVWKIA